MNDAYLSHLNDLFTTEEKELAIEYYYFDLAQKALDFLLHEQDWYFEDDLNPDLDVDNLIQDVLNNKSELKLLRIGCIQFIAGRGLIASRPFLNLGISGFNKLLRFFDFGLVRQELTDITDEGFTDRIQFRNSEGKEVILYNFVEKSEPV